VSKWSSGFVAAIAAACVFLSPFSVRAALTPSGDDDTAKIQAAIDAGGTVKQGFVDIGCYESKWSGTGLSVIIR